MRKELFQTVVEGLTEYHEDLANPEVTEPMLRYLERESIPNLDHPGESNYIRMRDLVEKLVETQVVNGRFFTRNTEIELDDGGCIARQL